MNKIECKRIKDKQKLHTLAKVIMLSVCTIMKVTRPKDKINIYSKNNIR